jgi:hypothetical protein
VDICFKGLGYRQIDKNKQDLEIDINSELKKIEIT